MGGRFSERLEERETFFSHASSILIPKTDFILSSFKKSWKDEEKEGTEKMGSSHTITEVYSCYCKTNITEKVCKGGMC